MKFELTLVRPTITSDPKAPTAPSRLLLRQASDRVLHDALALNDLPGLVETACDTMLVVAGVLAKYEQDPQVPDFVEGAQACIENARAVMDKGLLLQSWETVNCGAVMMEITLRGICATLGMPYEKVLARCHAARAAGESPEIRALLIAEGVIQGDAPAANDPAEHHPV